MSDPVSEAVIVWGEVLWDRFPEGDQLGGAPANLAWHLGQAGGWVQLVSRVGDDEAGRRAIERLAERIDPTLIQIDPSRATGLAQWQEAARAARRTCLRVCDLNLRAADRHTPAIGAALDAADLVKINDRELATLRDWLGWADPVAELRHRDRVVVVTHGSAGSTLFGESGAIEVAATPAASGGDNVGCGDAYLAILVHGLTLGWDLATSGRAASRWAAAVAEVRGATPLFSDEKIADLLEVA
ncbi:MAG: carbohydrate kinase family protein [Kofleriaceae bacterium]